jgi:hypothetical protein
VKLLVTSSAFGATKPSTFGRCLLTSSMLDGEAAVRIWVNDVIVVEGAPVNPGHVIRTADLLVVEPNIMPLHKLHA